MIAILPRPGWPRPLAWLAISGPHLLPPPQDRWEQAAGGVPGSYLEHPAHITSLELPRHPSTFSEPQRINP